MKKFTFNPNGDFWNPLVEAQASTFFAATRLIARLIDHLPESVTIHETHRPALIAWLRSLKGRSNSVRLTWETPGHLTLTHRDYDTVGATIAVPVTIDGQPPEIAFDPKYLADAFEIGPTLRLVDKLNPGMATGPSGNFCVLMSQRFTEETSTDQSASEAPAPAMAA